MIATDFPAARATPADSGRQQGVQIAGGLIETAHDESTGRPYLRVPMPDPELVERTLAAIGSLLEGYRKS